MTGYLLDTKAVILAVGRPEMLSAGVRDSVLAGPNVVSVVSYWEVLLKSMKGKLEVGDPRLWWRDALDQLGATVLPLRGDHIGEIYTLAQIHKDVFDRALIAQATVEDLTLLTSDSEIVKYGSERFRVVC